MTDHERVQEIIRLKEQAPIAIDPLRSALLVVDVQRYFASADDAWARTLDALVPGATVGYFRRVKSTVLPNIQRLLERFRSLKLPIIYTVAGSYLENGADLPEWLKGFNELGVMMVGERPIPLVDDPSWQIEASVAPLPGELVVNKTSSGPLSSTKLDQTLHNLGVNSLVVCGLTTAVCVAQTARETADRGFRVIVAEDACTEMSEEMHRAALESFSLVFGRVKRTDEVVSLFASAPSARTREISRGHESAIVIENPNALGAPDSAV